VVRIETAYTRKNDTCKSGSLGVQVKKWTCGLSLILTDELSCKVTDPMGWLWVNARGP
jgi:hypothetical protein